MKSQRDRGAAVDKSQPLELNDPKHKGSFLVCMLPFMERNDLSIGPNEFSFDVTPQK